LSNSTKPQVSQRRETIGLPLRAPDRAQHKLLTRFIDLLLRGNERRVRSEAKHFALKAAHPWRADTQSPWRDAAA
jgi:hypothetical protein